MILPLIFIAVGQSTGILLVSFGLALAIGAVIWMLALFLVWRGSRLFTCDRIATTT